MLVSSADDARAPGASKLATLVNHSSAPMEKGRRGRGKKRVVCTWFKDFRSLSLPLLILDASKRGGALTRSMMQNNFFNIRF